MRHKLKIIAILLSVCLLSSAMPCMVQAAPVVRICLDGREIANGQITDSRTFVPIRVLTENLGYTVDWDGNTQTVTVKKDAIVYSMQIGSTRALRTEYGLIREYYMDVAPMLIDSRTYVPLRFVSESFGCGVLWEGATQTVYISSALPMNLFGAELKLGATDLEEVEVWLGGLYDTVPGADGVQRNVYIQQDTKYITVLGLLDGQLFEFFTNDSALQIGETYVSQLSGGKYSDAAYVFTDAFEDGRVVGFYACAAGAAYNPYKENADKSAVMAQESKLTFYLTNALRELAGKKALTYSESLAQVDKAHVASMAENNFFAHEGLNGDDITDRIQSSTTHKKYTKLAEILAKMPNAYYACYGWLNSKSHRAAMLDNSYTYTGIAVDGNMGENLYYAQVLVRL